MIPAALSHIPLLQEIAIESCQPLGATPQSEGAGTNRCWRVRSGAGDWVVRCNGAIMGVDRQAEQAVLALVSSEDLTAPVIACEPEQGYLITQFLDLPPWTCERFGQPRQVAALARGLRQLHALPWPGARPADWQAELRQDFRDGPLAARSALLDGIEVLIETMDASGFDQGPRALCHHDLHGENILGHEAVRFIDWEYARWTHPAMDIAYLIQYHDLVPEQRDLLLQAYYGRAEPDTIRFTALAVRLAQYQELLWLARYQQHAPLPALQASRLRALVLVLT